MAGLRMVRDGEGAPTDDRAASALRLCSKYAARGESIACTGLLPRPDRLAPGGVPGRLDDPEEEEEEVVVVVDEEGAVEEEGGGGAGAAEKIWAGEGKAERAAATSSGVTSTLSSFERFGRRARTLARYAGSSAMGLSHSQRMERWERWEREATWAKSSTAFLRR